MALTNPSPPAQHPIGWINSSQNGRDPVLIDDVWAHWFRTSIGSNATSVTSVSGTSLIPPVVITGSTNSEDGLFRVNNVTSQTGATLYSIVSQVTSTAALSSTAVAAAYWGDVNGVGGGQLSGILTQARLLNTASATATIYANQSTAYCAYSAAVPSPISGYRAIFSNRPTDGSAVQNGISTNRYNYNSVAYEISAQPRSSAGEYCGFVRGVVFRTLAMDRDLDRLAIGVDFAEVTDAEVTARWSDAFRLRTGMTMEWNGNTAVYTTKRSDYVTGTDRWRLTSGGTERFGVNMATASIWLNATETYFTNKVRYSANDVLTATTLSFSGTQVHTTRRTGWTAPTGTIGRYGFDGDVYTVASATYQQTEVQAISDQLYVVQQNLAGLITDMTTHGSIGT